MKRCTPIVYVCGVCPNSRARHYSVDCEQHEHSYSTELFANALAEAMIHRMEASR